MKKLTALLLALVMVLAMNASALAETGILAGDAANKTAIDHFNFKVTVDKDSTVHTPATGATYTLTTGTADATNSVFAGDLANIGFSADYSENSTTTNFPVNNGANDAVNDVTVYAGNYTAPGIYRYTLTESNLQNEDLGFEFKDAQVKTLDIYVKKEGNDFIVYAATLYNPDPGATNEKTDGFTIVYTDEPGDPSTPGSPESPASHDVTVKKTISGNAAVATEEFDFTVTITVDGIATDGLVITMAQAGSPAGGLAGKEVELKKNTEGTATSAVITGKMKGDDEVTFKGLPETASVVVTENYKDYVASEDENTLTGGTNSTDATAKTWTESGTVPDGDANVTINNDRDTISPTGVVLRVAPYAIMLGAGVVLFIILKSRKNKAVEEA